MFLKPALNVPSEMQILNVPGTSKFPNCIYFVVQMMLSLLTRIADYRLKGVEGFAKNGFTPNLWEDPSKFAASIIKCI